MSNLTHEKLKTIEKMRSEIAHRIAKRKTLEHLEEVRKRYHGIPPESSPIGSYKPLTHISINKRLRKIITI